VPFVDNTKLQMATNASILRIGNAQGFWGDSSDAPARLVSQAPDLDVLTLDYLAEVSMSILAKQRERDADAGFPRDFLSIAASLAPVWRSGRKLKLITNAGGLNPTACAHAVAAILRDAGCRSLRIGVVSGDDVLEQLRAASPGSFAHLETGQPLSDVFPNLVTANAYIGAAPIAEALRGGADWIITGRVADPSLAVGACLHHFGWPLDDYDRIAGATIAGHLIECGTQVTGGISTDWLDLPNNGDLGFPIVEVSADGSCVVTKPAGTGGRVERGTVAEQLVYEIGDPSNYLSPDATVSFTDLQLQEDGPDRIRVAGARGRPPPLTYKVSATYRAGYRAAGTLAIFGRNAVAKARRCGEIVLARLAELKPQRSLVECLGAGDVVPVAAGHSADPLEVVLRIAVADPRREVVERFAREIMPLVTAGPQGVTGYGEGRPVVREAFGYWPTLIPRSAVLPRVEVLEV
jgi:hypothetical protein